MAELPPKLDDEKHWVPADILPDEMTYMEELAQQLSSYTLCEHQPQQQQQQQQQTQTKIVAKAKPVSVKVQPNQNNFVSRGTGVYNTSDQGGGYRALTTGYQFSPAITTPPVVATPTQGVQTSTRARALQNQGVGGGGSWFLPFQANVGVGGFAKGTGVFLPRVDHPIEATRKHHQQQKGISCDENCYYKVPVKRNGNKKNSGGKKEVVGLKATTEISLPQEWTY